MNIDEKFNLAIDIINRIGVAEDKEAVVSIADCIKNNRFFYEMSEGKIVLFLTWSDDIIDGKRYIFVNNLWIEPSYRAQNTLVRVRTALKYLLGKSVYRFYWHDRKKDKVVYRR
jgi:hypothetical protein